MCNVLPVEVGCRGFVAKSMLKYLKMIEASSKQVKNTDIITGGSTDSLIVDLEAEASAVILFTCKGRSVGIDIW